MYFSIYINQLTDYRFKHLLGEEHNEDLLIDFPNGLLKGQQAPIASLPSIR